MRSSYAPSRSGLGGGAGAGESSDTTNQSKPCGAGPVERSHRVNPGSELRYLGRMRTILALALLVPLFGVPLACGGGTADTGGAAHPEPAGSSAPSAAGSSVAAAVDAGPATTTTATLGAGGDLQGAKLTQTTTVASTTGSSAPAPTGPHTHDPGRGVADLKAIMVAHKDEARACYEAALPTHPGIEGDLVMQLTIDPKGNVTQVSLDSSRSQILEPSVAACVAKVIQKIQFAPSPGGYETRTTFPYNFKPRKATATH